MNPRKLVVAIAGGVLLSAPAGIGRTDGIAALEPMPETHSTPEGAASSEEMVIERVLTDGPAETIMIRQGTTVRLILHVPTGVELHLHGYDLAETATGEAPVVMTFRADHAGRFPIEAHGVEDVLGRSDRALAYVEVRPE